MAKKVLVVDDSASTRESVRMILHRQGFSIVTAVDGIDALRKYSEEVIDLVITEINLPNLDGFSFTEELRQGAKDAETPIIILTIEQCQDLKQRAMRLGATDWLEKPLKAQKLIKVVERELN